MARTRERTDKQNIGYIKWPDGSLYREARYNLERDTVVDNPPGMWNDFTVTKRWSSATGVSGVSKYNGDIFENWCPMMLRDPAFGFVATVPGSLTDGEAATKLLKITNPSRPVVSIPNFVWELREIPQLLRSEGGSFLRRAGSTNLNYQFGIAPLVGDLFKLLTFSDQVANRTRELQDLYSSGLRRKRSLFDGTATGSGGTSLNSSDGVWLSADWTCNTAERIWGYVEWRPDGTIPLDTANDYRSLARRAVLGLTIDFSVAWEAIPWSWLIDWCTNVGDYLAAKRNLVGATPGPVYIMRHVRSETIFKPKNDYGQPELQHWIPSTGIRYPDVHRKWERKSRRQATPSISAQLPFLSLRQMSILGSIGVTRRAGRNPR